MHIQFKMLKVGIGTNANLQDVYDHSSNSQKPGDRSYVLEQKGVYQEC